MSNVRPDELVKWLPYEGDWWWVSTRDTAAKWGTEASRNAQPLTQDDLERVATLSMLAPGTIIEGLGEVWADCEVFYLYPRAGDSNE